MADGDPSEEAEDERSIELQSLAAIFPELVILPYNEKKDLWQASLEVEVEPSEPVQIRTPKSNDVAAMLEPGEVAPNDDETHNLAHLPPLKIDICLPRTYPDSQAPSIILASEDSWLSTEKINLLRDAATLLWDQTGRDQILFSYIDYVREQADAGFGITHTLAVTPDLKLALLDFDLKARKVKFERGTYDCGVCLEPKKGSVCHRLQACSHVFCLDCLQDFYTNCITEGDIGNVKCLTPKCPGRVDPLPAPMLNGEALAAEPPPNGAATPAPTPQDPTLEPSELLQMNLPQETIQRYIDLKRKRALELDISTIYCPRQWCQSPSRHKLPPTCPFLQHRDPPATPPPIPEPGDRLAICENCTFAFCLVCKAGWHGEYKKCMPLANTELQSEEEKQSHEYMLLHTQGCPTCNARAQKTHGCNHMICFKCDTHFCYLCGAYLEKGNPYTHFNEKKNSCYMRLWELEQGDGGDVGQGFAGGEGDLNLNDVDGWSEDEDDDEDEMMPDPRNVIVWPEDEEENQRAAPQEAAQRPWAPPAERVRRAGGGGGGPALRQFLEMARNDMEDEWDSDEMSSDEDEPIGG